MELTAKKITENLPEFTEICELMDSAFPKNEQISIDKLLLAQELKEGVNFRAFYDEESFCGIMYTIENEKYLFVLYLAVNDKIRSKGYGSRILNWLKSTTTKTIVLNVETLNPSASNFAQREKRILFYEKNGIVNSGCHIKNRKEENLEPFAVLTSDKQMFNAQEYIDLLNGMFGDIYSLM